MLNRLVFSDQMKLIHSNGFPHISKDLQHKLKIFGIAALVVGTGWYLHKYYQQCHNTQDITSNLNDNGNDNDDMLTIQALTALSPKRREEIKIASPIIKVHDAVYGLSRIELNNLCGQETNFQMEIAENNNIQLIDFNAANIAIDTMSNKKYIHCRLPLRLNDYYIQFRIRCKVKDFWSSFSQKIKLNVPSSLISRNFEINETVTFVLKGSNSGSKGIIVKILDNDCGLYIIQSTFDRKYHFVDYSRMYRNGPYLRNVIHINANNMAMDKNILFGNQLLSMQSMDVFNILSKIYKNYAKSIKIYVDIHHVFIGRFIAKNVMDFLLCSNSKKSRGTLVNCMMEYNDRFMKVVPVWNNHIANSIELCEMGVHSIVNINCSFWCDLCGIEISKYDWIYRCDTTLTDRHFFCLNCVWNIVEQHKQLTQFLTQYLQKYLYDVCIQEISSFVCGAVVYCD